MNTLSGGCECGAVRYTLTGPPGFSFLCQCRACQHMTGAGHAAGFKIDKDALTIAGRLQYWSRTADSGQRVTTYRCAICASPLYNAPAAMPDAVILTPGSLDDPAAFTPQKIVHAATAQPWDTITLPPHGDAT